MPPKARWNVQPTQATPDFNKASSVVHSVGPKPTTMSEAIKQLRAFVVRTITDSNLLQLKPEEIESTSEIIATTTDKAEIFNWANTLMLPEAFAAEVVKRREDITRLGTRTDDDTVSTTSLATSASKAARKKQGAGVRGRNVNLASKDKDETGGLVEGQLFECGCFATQHAYKANCLNCGRIICMQESDESCYACGFEPGVCLAYEVKLAEGLIDAAADAKNRADYDKAIAQRDKLMSYARERAKRTIVIDDQSGMYANTAWISQEEREASRQAETDERKRVAALHRSTGAYQVHLDIVNQSTALGATGLLSKAENAIMARQNAGDAADASGPKRLTDAEIAAQYGLEGAAAGSDADGDEADNNNPTGPEVPAELRAAAARAQPAGKFDQRAARRQAAVAFQDAIEQEEEEEYDTAAAASRNARIEALPSLVQRIFYGGDAEASSTIVASRRKADGPVETKLPGVEDAPMKPSAAGAGAAGSATAQQKPAVARVVPQSLRVQTDYYEDDKVTWRIARQTQKMANDGSGGDPRRGGGSRRFRDDDSDGGASDDAASSASSSSGMDAAKRRRARPPPPPPAASDGAGAAPSHAQLLEAAGAATADEPSCRPRGGGAGPSPTPGSSVAEQYAEAGRRLKRKDEGMCLSMHQPWASLLVAGIKTHEGRPWGSDFRGRLWIHAAAAHPSHVAEIEAQYAPLLKPGQTFPTDYPTSCLLGYVVAVDNLDRAQYEATFAPEERQESSEYKFICEAAHALPFPLAMDGKHKIFKLEKKLWLAARKQLNEGPPK